MMVFLGCYRFFESVILQTLSIVHKVSFLRDTESKMICRVGGSVMALEKRLCWPSGFPSWREGEELQEGEAVNLCLHRKQSSWWLCSVNTIKQLIINVDFTWKEKRTWKVKGIWITLSESFQKTDELHMLITRVCLDPQTWCSQPWWMVFDCLLGICNPTPPLIPSVEIYCIFYSPGCCLSLNKTHTHQKKWARAVVFLEDG